DIVTIDAPVWQLARGHFTDSLMRVTAAKATLRFNSDGDLITRLPKTLTGTSLRVDRLPAMVIDKSELTFAKDQHGKIVVNAIDAGVSKINGQLVLSGTADSEVGELEIHGSFDESAQLAKLRVATKASAHVGHDLLERLPFVPSSVFRELQVQHGDATAAL